MKKKTSPIWAISETDLRMLVEKSKSMAELLRHFGLNNKGNNFKTMKAKLAYHNIDTSKFLSNWGKCHLKETPLEEVLIENSKYCRTSLKKRIISQGLIENKCNCCGCEPIWNNKPLVLVLDHINGVSNDNRLENLRLLCPNCNSQTPTFAGRNNRKPKYTCACGKQIGKHSTRCNSCSGRLKSKVERPTKDELQKMVWESPTSTLAKQLGVSDKAISKWCKSYGIEKPSRGHWRQMSTLNLI